MPWFRLLAIAALISLAGCAVNPRPASYLVDPQGPYTLDAGDVVRVTVYGDEELTDTYRVDDSGAIAFPLVGRVAARGATTQAVAGRITAGLADGFMRSPNVAVEVAEYRPFYIQGEVGLSGQYPYAYGMTVRAAISTAGGYTDTADRTRALIYRRHGNEMARDVVGLDTLVQPGDTVVVPERWL